MIYGSICSGIEAATVAWHGLGWKPAFFSEVEPFPRAVLAHRWPGVPVHGDFTTIQPGDYAAIDLLVGGTPCQSFSVAGLRGGLDDDRGNLALEYLRLADRLRPRWLVWENVPGVLSSSGGRDFGAILGGMVELGYGFAYRVLDAQHLGVPQRRRRVFVVGYSGNWRPAAAVLFERHSLQGHHPPRREAGARIAGALTGGSGDGGADDNDCRAGHIVGALGGTSPGGGWRFGADEAAAGQLIAGTLNANGKAAGSATSQDAETGMLVTHTLRGDGFDASEDGTGRGTPLIPVAYGGNNTAGPVQVAAALAAHGGPHGRQDFASETFVSYGIRSDAVREGSAITPSPDAEGRVRLRNPGLGITADCAPTVDSSQPHIVAFSAKDHGADLGETAPTLRAGGHSKSHANAGVMPAVHIAAGVRRLTPRECERLQGFPDDYTLIPWRKAEAPDGPRYKALGNSMAVPVMAWIGRRIEAVEALLARAAA